MKSKWNLLYAAIATALLLTACSTDNDNTNGSSNPVEENEKKPNEGQDEADTPADTPDSDGMKDATLTDSEEQDYTIAVLPHYTLTSEEPGKDSLMSDADGSHFMRIETTVKEEGTYDYFVDNMIDVLEAASEGSTPSELTDEASIPKGDGIDNVKVFSTQTETGPVTGIVFERNNMIVRLTIFDSPEEEHFSNFLHMGETIMTK
ncbi:hypothetical protein [Sporosarcina sp. NPDC096371]|uniref:hypothetical protein n=1 Tax=Sporosarcina sp. NPDC096371 TaxID=3364530 RepID=UPI00381A9D9B